MDFFEENLDLASHVVSYLGVRSLMHFSMCRQAYRHKILAPEVERRQAQFAAYENKVMTTLDPSSPISTPDLLHAKSLYDQAQDLVDYELNWRDRLVWTEPDPEIRNQALATTMRANPFLEQIRRMTATDGYPPSHPPFFMLPLCFYKRPQTLAGHPPQEFKIQKQTVEAGKHYASWIWGAEDHMGTFYEMGFGFDPYFRNPKYPFRKFKHPLNQFFLELMHDLIGKLRADEALKGIFRGAARKLALSRPGATDCLHYVLHHADGYASEEEGDEEDGNSSHEEDSNLRFQVGEMVQANVGSYQLAKVLKHWDEGNAYRLEIQDDERTNVWAPRDEDGFIRAVPSSASS